MKLLMVDQAPFRRYGQVLKGYDLNGFVELLKTMPIPDNGFVYKASEPILEADPAFEWMQSSVNGGMPLQLGYCNGRNDTLNCLEYHKGSEICVMAYDTILFLGFRGDIDGNGQYDTAKVEAFLVPAGTAVELFATTLHYAPISAAPGQPYIVANGLPRDTNGERPRTTGYSPEDRMLWGSNKWLLVHADSDEARQGAHIGLVGKNLTFNDIDR